MEEGTDSSPDVAGRLTEQNVGADMIHRQGRQEHRTEVEEAEGKIVEVVAQLRQVEAVAGDSGVEIVVELVLEAFGAVVVAVAVAAVQMICALFADL